MTTETKSKSQQTAADVVALLKARNPLLWVVTREEARVERFVMEAAAAANYLPRTWDVAAGVCNISGQPERNIGGQDPGDTMRAIDTKSRETKTNDKGEEVGERGAWIMRDMPVWLNGGLNTAGTLRQLRNLARSLPGCPRTSAQAVIILTPSADVPPELVGHATVINWPLPDRQEIADILGAAIRILPPEVQETALNGSRESAIDAAIGLTGEEAAACYAKSLVLTRTIDPAAVAMEKKRLVSKIDGVEWFDPLPGGLSAVGGLDLFKQYLVQRAVAWTPEARAYGLPLPVGALVAGHSGCGKSLTAKALGTAWQCPVLRIDMGAFKSKFVGDSERNLRAAFEIVAAIGRCVVWFDEIEKALAGASQGAADGGVSSDALGFILTWLQERRGEAFAFATCNKVDVLPPELLRRFDTVWFVDLPTHAERSQIIRAAMKANAINMDAADVDEQRVAQVTDGFNGDQVARLVPDAMYLAFADGAREITTDDLLTVAASRVPFNQTAAEAVFSLRTWAATRARPATSKEQARVQTGGRELDI
jgi:hypothetical protein